MGVPRTGSLALPRGRTLIALDSNVVIDLLRQRQAVRERFDAARGADLALFMSVLALEEILFGIERSASQMRERSTLTALLATVEVVPFEVSDAEVASRARAEMTAQGKPPPQVDLLIGAHALARGLTLATANTRDFQNIPGLKLVDWTQARTDPQD